MTIERATHNEGGASTCQDEISWWNGQKVGLVCYFRTLRAQPVVATPLFSCSDNLGRCNTGPKFNPQMFQWLNSFKGGDSKKTLPCLGLREYSPKDQVSLKSDASKL